MKYIFFLILVLPSAVLAEQNIDLLIDAALERTKYSVEYDGKYISIPYPNGDVPAQIGVCTDVVIRSYRILGIDLQKLVHEDMSKNFNEYPSNRIWGLKKPDTNIDHRRVPNLKVFFSKYGETLVISNNLKDYKPGDLVTWMLPDNFPHIGIIVDKVDSATGIPLVVHNIGMGPKLENMLFNYKITGHYKYLPK